MGLRFADKIFQVVEKYCDTVFFLPGGQAMYLVDALGKSNLHKVAMLHEQGAGYAACGHAQYNNTLGVCLTTGGPGATNAITPCLAAWMDSISVLFISGQVATQNLIGDSGLRSRGGQEADIISVVKPITKLALRLTINETPKDIEELISIALMGRKGPVWLDIPLDVQKYER